MLGKGGMGVVFEAEDTALRRLVALKLVALEEHADDRGSRPLHERRFLREASLSAQINHPNVVTIYDYGRGEEDTDRFCYIAMELLVGESLGERLRRLRGGLPPREVVAIVTQIARGLRAAHMRGLVHRDLKPDNVMLTPGEDGEDVARIVDFGLAKDTTSPRELVITGDGSAVGTPEYMAPEQVEAGEVDARTDLYALGILMFEALTGSPPFKHENPFRTAAAHVREPLPPMVLKHGRERPSIALRRLVIELLEKRADARPRSADEVLKRLRALPESRAIHARHAGGSRSRATRGRGEARAEHEGSLEVEAPLEADARVGSPCGCGRRRAFLRLRACGRRRRRRRGASWA